MVKGANYYVRVYCDWALVDHLNIEIAQQRPHLLGKLQDHLGGIPIGLAFFSGSLPDKIDRMRAVHPDFKKAFALMQELSASQLWAVCAWELLIHKRPEGAGKTLATGADVAEYLGESYDRLKKQRQRGLQRINNRLDDERNAEKGFIVA
ncbi:MAG: hypothetical protein CSB48_02875 [Proteobacteria bacterium]|nr:MAG: hypothetical protein CSB48_02875 [Pseudomonadota bacterium]